MEFNVNNMIFVCENGDCEEVDHRCCVKCEKYDECLLKGWICNKIDENKQILYCEDLAIRFETVL